MESGVKYTLVNKFGFWSMFLALNGCSACTIILVDWNLSTTEIYDCFFFYFYLFIYLFFLLSMVSICNKNQCMPSADEADQFVMGYLKVHSISLSRLFQRRMYLKR